MEVQVVRRPGFRPSPRLVLAAVSALSTAVLLLEARDQWFFNDDWGQWGTNRQGPTIEHPWRFFFGDHNGHWMTLNRVLFELAYRAVGLRSYLPYLMPVLVLHVAATWLVFGVARRAGVRPWLACAGAAVFAFFGSGAEVLTWADAFGFAAPLAFGTAQLLLADHDGPVDRRDLLGALLGVLGIMSGGAALTMVGVVACAAALRRRWRPLVVAVAPQSVAWIVWFLAIGHEGERTTADREHAPQMAAYFWRAVSSSVESITQLGVSGLVVAALVAFAWWRPTRFTERGRAPVAALAAGLLLFAAQTTVARVNLGVELAASSRYLYIGGFLVLPLLLLAIDDVVERVPRLVPVALVLLVWAAVANAFAIDSFARTWGPREQQIREAVLTVAQLDGLDAVPAGTRLVPLDGSAFEPEWAPTVDVIRALRDHGDLPHADPPSRLDRLSWSLALLVRTDALRAGAPAPLPATVVVRGEGGTTVAPSGNGCVTATAGPTQTETRVTVSGATTLWLRSLQGGRGSLGLAEQAVRVESSGHEWNAGVSRLTLVPGADGILGVPAPTLDICG